MYIYISFSGGKKHSQLQYVPVCSINWLQPSPVSSAFLNLQAEFVAYEIVQQVDEKA